MQLSPARLKTSCNSSIAVIEDRVLHGCGKDGVLNLLGVGKAKVQMGEVEKKNVFAILKGSF